MNFKRGWGAAVAVGAVLLCPVLLSGCPGGGEGGTGGGSGGGGGAGTGGGSGGGSVTIAPFNYEFPRDSFPFENYVNQSPQQPFTPVNLTQVEMVRLFGKQVCGDPNAASCALTPAAQKWMEATNNSMGGGHCEGMAVLSALFAVGVANPQAFGGATGFQLSLANNEALQREIAYWWALQGTEPTISSERPGQRTPNEVLTDLAVGLDAGQAFTFGLSKRDKTGGHANTPYRIEPESNGVVRVLLYENNFPNSAKAVEFNVAANTWRYEATPNPMTPAEVYDGDATTKNISIIPISARLQPAVCPFCGEVASDGMMVRGAAAAYRELQLSGDGELKVSVPGTAQSIFRDGNGNWVNQISGATLTANRVGPSTWARDIDPIFRLPLATPLTVELDGRRLSSPGQAGVVLTAPGYTFAVEGVNLDPGQVDTIGFSAGPGEVTYQTNAMETPVVSLGVSLQGEDYLFLIAVGAETGGVQVKLRNDVPAGALIVDIDAADGSAAYAVEVHRVGAGDVVFNHAANTIAAAATVYIKYAGWTGQGAPMQFDVDTDGDGTPDMTQMVADDN